MVNFVFDMWETSAPSVNQRTSIFTSYVLQHGRHRWHMIGKNTLTQRNFLTLGQRWLNDVTPTATMATLCQRSCANGGDVAPT